MAQFFLIDPSWRTAGDHHGEVGAALARAAVLRGMRTRIAVHRDFDGDRTALAPATIVPLFRQTSYQATSLLAGIQAIKRGGWLRPQQPLPGWSWWAMKARIQNWAADRRHFRYARRYAESLAEFFHGQTFDGSTCVLFSTASDVDFAGIGAFLRATPNTIQAHWHFLFHFNLFQGRTPNYEQQEWRVNALRERFLMALYGLPYHQLHFHTTTEHLADQYNRLQIAKFTVLPYPVAVNAEPQTAPQDGPLRFSCLGAVRREKQQVAYLQHLVDRLWSTHLATGRIALQVQTTTRSRLGRAKINLRLPRETPGDTQLKCSDTRCLTWIPHPMPRAAYERLLNQTDCGLLLYDAEVYFSRRAGILDELLALGRPVIVSAGSWLADELSPALFRHVQQTVDGAPFGRPLDVGDLHFSSSNLPSDGGVFSFDAGDHPLDMHVDLAAGETAVAIQFQWRSPLVAGTYIRVELIADKMPRGTLESCRILGQAPKGTMPGVILRLPVQGDLPRRVTLRLTNAFHHAAICIQNLRVTALASAELPLAAVGLTVTGHQQLPDAIDEMHRYYRHYRETAARLAEQRKKDHEPDRVIQWLFGRRQPARRAA